MHVVPIATFNWVSVAFGLVAAGLWYWSTRVEVLHDPNAVDDQGITPMSITVESTIAGKRADVLSTAARQVIWNRWAAMAASAAALCQAVAMALTQI